MTSTACCDLCQPIAPAHLPEEGFVHGVQCVAFMTRACCTYASWASCKSGPMSGEAVGSIPTDLFEAVYVCPH